MRDCGYDQEGHLRTASEPDCVLVTGRETIQHYENGSDQALELSLYFFSLHLYWSSFLSRATYRYEEGFGHEYLLRYFIHETFLKPLWK